MSGKGSITSEIPGPWIVFSWELGLKTAVFQSNQVGPCRRLDVSDGQEGGRVESLFAIRS
jgi:hypothetical protein